MRGVNRRLIMVMACATILMGGAGCGTGDPGQSSSASESSFEVEPHDPTEACPPEVMGECLPIAVADLDGSGKPAAFSLHPTGTQFITARVGNEQYSAELGTEHAQLTQPLSKTEMVNGIGFYNLDGRPGAEVVVPLGSRGANAIFQVFSLRDNTLQVVSPPGETLDITLGTGFWSFPTERILARALCSDKGLTLASAEVPGSGDGTAVDFISSARSGPGESGEWTVSRSSYAMDRATIADMSRGQQHFSCEDQRTFTFSSQTAPSSNTSEEECASATDTTAVVREAIASLPEINGWEWQQESSEVIDPCLDLSFATTTVAQATNSSPVAILLFHRGKFVETASTCSPPISDVRNDGDDAVVVTYRYPRGNEPNAAMTGRATRTYTWTDGEIVKSGEVPQELVALVGCTP